MEKYITSVKDFVLESLSQFSLIKTSADRGDAESCFKMGLIQLLGINTNIDFKKASEYFSNKSLTNNQDANRLLGFIAECEGNISSAFQYYSKTINSEKDSYFDKVIKGRKILQDDLKKLDLPIALNKEISAILSDYSKGKASKVGASVKIAAICNDEPSCLEAANALFASKDYISAVQWLQKGKISQENSLFASINEIIAKSKKSILQSKDLQIIDLDGNSLLSNEDPTPFLNTIKKTCEAASMKSSIEWKEKNKKRVDTIVKNQKTKEKKEWEAVQAEMRQEKKKKRIIKHSIICIILFILGVASNKEGGSGSEFLSGVIMVLGCYFWFYFIRWLWRLFFGKKK